MTISVRTAYRLAGQSRDSLETRDRSRGGLRGALRGQLRGLADDVGGSVSTGGISPGDGAVGSRSAPRFCSIRPRRNRGPTRWLRSSATARCTASSAKRGLARADKLNWQKTTETILSLVTGEMAQDNQLRPPVDAIP